jgi:hypothetical protein
MSRVADRPRRGVRPQGRLSTCGPRNQSSRQGSSCGSGCRTVGLLWSRPDQPRRAVRTRSRMEKLTPEQGAYRIRLMLEAHPSMRDQVGLTELLKPFGGFCGALGRDVPVSIERRNETRRRPMESRTWPLGRGVSVIQRSPGAKRPTSALTPCASYRHVCGRLCLRCRGGWPTRDP